MQDPASLFQPDPLIAAQYFATLKRKAHLEPERELMLAVLEDAVHCFKNYFLSTRPRWRSLFRDTEEWLFCREENDWPFSYDNVCGILGIDPDYLRRGLRRWEAEMRGAGSAVPSAAGPKACGKRKYRKSA